MKRFVLLVAALGAIPACGGDSGQTVTALFDVPGGPHPAVEFYELPFPNDIRRTADGHPDMAAYPRPNVLVGKYADAIAADLDGFGLNAAVFFRFDGALDTTTLPATPTASIADAASIYLVNIDPASPDKGQKTPLRFRFEARKGETIGENWLSALPFPGFPLDEGTTYALIVTDRVEGGGGPVARAPDFDAIAGAAVPSNAVLAAAQARYAKLWAYLDEPGGDERADVVTAAVFTTQHATAIMGQLRARVWTLAAPTASGVARITQPDGTIFAYDGMFPSPNFQVGTVPYDTGGNIVMDTDGLPKVQRTESLRVSFAIPTGTKPQTGWPVAIYAHGTGGSYHSYLNDHTAGRLAAQGIATISIDQVLHGPRNPGGNPEVAFFNFQNPQAARYNAIQGAADDYSVVRLVENFNFVEGPNGQDPGRTITFDPAKIYFFGHSQGGLTGPPFLAYEPDVKGAVLSGAGALLYEALLTKTEPVDITALVAAVIRDQPLDEFNPILTLLQTWVERSDAANYGPLLVRRPVIGPDGTTHLAPKPIFQTEGFTDHYAPNATIEGFAVSIGGNQVEPTHSTIEGLALRNRQVLAAPTASGPINDNLDGTTAVLLQYDQQAGSDGHFVVFDVPAAETQSSRFLGTLSATGTADLVAP